MTRKPTKKRMLKMTPYSKQILGWIGILSAVVLAISFWFVLDLGYVTAGILLAGLGLILIIETIFEEIKTVTFSDTITIFLGAISIILGIVTITQISLPEFIANFRGWLAILMAFAIGWEMYR